VVGQHYEEVGEGWQCSCDEVQRRRRCRFPFVFDEKEREERFREFWERIAEGSGCVGGGWCRNMRVRRSMSGIGSLSLTAAAGLRGPTTTAVDENGF